MNEEKMGPADVGSVPGRYRISFQTLAVRLLQRFRAPACYVRATAGDWTTVKEPPNEAVLVAHLEGATTIGLHPSAGGRARVGVIDVDLHTEGEPTADAVAANERYAFKKLDELAVRGIKALLVRGHDAGSFHLFFDVEIDSIRLGRWLRDFVADAGTVHVDTFPSATGGGNAIRLPGRHHRRPDQWSAAWNGSEWEPWPAAIHKLCELPDNDPALFADPDLPPPPVPPVVPPAALMESRPGDLFNLTVPVEQVLTAYGWSQEREQGDRVYWRRPGKEQGISASVRDGTVWVFTSSVPGLEVSSDGGQPYTAFGLLAHLEFGGDFKAAARELKQRGFCAAPATASNGRVRVSPTVPTYTPFPVEVLPAVPQRYVRGIAEAMNCDPAYSALPVLAALGAAIGGSHVITPKDGWREPPYIWAVAIGRSGAVKSPPYRDIEDIAEDINDRLEREFADAEVNGADAPDDPDECTSGTCAPAKPVKRAFVKGDVTIEALIGALQANPRGLLIAQDELNGWVGGFARYTGKSGASALPQWLQLHHAGTINYTRKTGDPDKREVRVRGVGVSVTGTIQPAILARVLTEEFRSSGLLARLLLAMPPWRQRRWTEAVVPADARDGFADLVRSLHQLPAGSWDDGRPRPHLVRLSDEAKRQFVAFYDANGAALGTADEDTAAAMSKLEGYALRFALIFHLARLKEYGKDAKVTATDMAAAIRLTEWFRDEAERVYSMLGQTAEQRAAAQLFEVAVRLADRLAPQRNGFRGVTPRDLQNHHTKKYPSSAHAEAALESLVGAGYGTWSAGPPKTRPGGHTPKYFVPRTTPDISDGRAGDGVGRDDGPSDTRPDPDPPAPTPPGAPQDVTCCGTAGCDSPVATGGGQVSELSDVEGDQIGSGEGTEAPVADAVAANAECRTTETREVSTPTVITVTDPKGLGAVVAAIGNADVSVGIDTETTGLDPRKDKVRLIQVATPAATYVIDVFALPDPDVLGDLFSALRRVEVVGHNLQFDLRFLASLGFVPGRVSDTMLASRLLSVGRPQRSGTRPGHKLAEVVERELGRTLDKAEQTSDWTGPLTESQVRYAAADAAVLVPLARVLKEKVATANLAATSDLEMRALLGVAWARSVTLDQDAWLGLAQSAERERDRLAGEMDALAGGTIKWSSPQQVRAAFETVGVPLDKTDDDTLAGVEHPLAGLLREYRGQVKRCGTYGRKWVETHVGAGGAVQPSWNQMGAESGRMSCSDPNLQQIPRGSEYRRCFTARPGCVLVKCDYSQIELRIAARIANESVMIGAYRDGRDLHALTAARVLNKAEADVTRDDRQLAKAVNFGLLYGMGWRALQQYARSNYGVALSDAQAKRYRAAFFDAYPALARWHERTGAHAKQLFSDNPNGWRTVATRGGRRRCLSVAKKRSDGTRYPNVTDALNTPVQGTGADGLKAAIALLWERRGECPTAVPVLFVHDEIVVEAREADAERTKVWLVRAMTDGMAPLIDPVPVVVEATIGRTWAGD